MRLFVTRGVFSDEVLAIDEMGASSAFATVPGGIGIAAIAEGGLVVAGKTSLDEGATGALWRVDASGTAALLLDENHEGAPLMFPNGVAQSPDGRLVFTDSEADVVYACDLDGTNVEVVTTGIDFPNGVAFSNDGATLYLAEWNAGVIHRLSFEPSSSTYGAPEAWVSGIMNADGIAVTADGDLIVASSTAGVFLVDGDGAATAIVPRGRLTLPANVGIGVAPFETDRAYISVVGGTGVMSLGLE